MAVMGRRFLILAVCFGPAFYFSCNHMEKGLGSASSRRTIYINSQTGDDRNRGTIRKPIKTIPEACKRMQAKPSNICFAGSQVFSGNMILQNITGTEKDSVFIGSYDDGRAVINGGNGEAIRIEGCQYIKIRNLDLKGNGRKNGNTTNGLSLVKTANSSVEQLTAEGFRKSGVELYDCRNTDIRKVSASDNGFCGINVMGSEMGLSGNIQIQDCKAENNPGDPTILDNHSGNGILVGMSDGVTIDHCTATDNGWDMPRKGNGPVGIWAWMSDHIVIRYCISYRNKTSVGGKDGGGFDLDGGVTNSLIQYCLSYENQGAGYGLFQYPGAADWKNNTIRYCVSINDANTTEGAGSFFIWNGSDESGQLSGCFIYNNVVYNTSSPVISFENASEHENFIFFNNIFLGSGNAISGNNKGSRFLGNVWWSGDGKIRFGEFESLFSWAKATGQETENGRITGMQTDPILNGPYLTEITDPYKLPALSGFMLKAESPIRNHGIPVKSLYGFDPPESDFYGNPVPQGPGTEPGIHELK